MFIFPFMFVIVFLVLWHNATHLQQGEGEGRTREARDKASRGSNLNLPTGQVPHQSKLAMCYFLIIFSRFFI
jgi:hypothetical protein